MLRLFLESEALQGRIRQIAEEIAQATENKVIFEEYIALPYYGNIILRFNLAEPEITLDLLDAYERRMYEIVRDEFMVDFMGCVYQSAGVDYRNIAHLMRNASEKYKDEQICQSKYAQQIRQDAKYLLQQCNRKGTESVWEIQPEEELVLLMMAKEPGEPEYHLLDGRTVIVAEVDEICCEGLMKAAFYGKRTHQSLARVFTTVS